MCQPKPGPRCARHIQDQINRLEAQRDADLATFMAGGTPAHRNIAGDLARLHDEYDETATGQRALRDQITALEAANPAAYDPWSGDPAAHSATRVHLATLQARLHEATQRRAAKLAALKSAREGNPRAGQFQLRYGAHAGWLHASDLPEQAARGHLGRLTVHPGYAIATLNVDTHAEEDLSGNPIDVTDIDVAWETPVRPGPRPGTWMTGDPQHGLGGATPYLYDEHTHTLTTDTATVDLHRLADLSPLDPDDDLATHTGYRDTDRGTVHDATATLRRGPDGSPMTLRVEACITTENHHEYALAHQA